MRAFGILLATVLLYLWLFWYLYVLLVGLYRAHLDRRLTRFALTLALPAIAVGYLVDLVANWTIATLVFAEPPHRPLELVTDRLRHYIDTGSGWRKTVALWLCTQLLDYFDRSGKHCK